MGRSLTAEPPIDPIQRIQESLSKTAGRAGADLAVAALRGGDNIGEHHVIFAAAGEQLELTHRATNRGIYSKGAVRAALWLVGKPPGLYGMKEVLGL